MTDEDELYRIRVALERMVLLFETIIIKLDRKAEVKPEVDNKAFGRGKGDRSTEEFDPFV